MIAGLILTGASLGLFPGLTGPLVIPPADPKCSTFFPKQFEHIIADISRTAMTA